MANLVLKNNTGTASSITFDNKSGSDWKIINNNGTFTLNGKSTNLFTMSDTGIATFVNNIILTGTDTHISKTCSAASSKPIFNVIAKDYDIDVLRVSYDTNNPGGYGFSLRYKGTGSGNNNSLQLLADNQNATTQITGLTMNQDGCIGILTNPDPGSNSLDKSALTINGYVKVDNGNIRAFQSDTDAIIWCENGQGIGLMVDHETKNAGLFHRSSDQYMLWYNPTTNRNQQASTYFVGTPCVANSTYWPALHFSSSNAEESFMGRICYGLSSDKDKTTYDVNRFYFQQYSFKEGTKTKMDKEGTGNSAYNPYERFRLPTTEPNLTGKHNYDILTTKHTVTVAQGGTGYSSQTAKRLCFTTNSAGITSGYHYADADHVGINTTTMPQTALGVGGSITVNNAIISTTTLYLNSATNTSLIFT